MSLTQSHLVVVCGTAGQSLGGLSTAVPLSATRGQYPNPAVILQSYDCKSRSLYVSQHLKKRPATEGQLLTLRNHTKKMPKLEWSICSSLPNHREFKLKQLWVSLMDVTQQTGSTMAPIYPLNSCSIAVKITLSKTCQIVKKMFACTKISHKPILQNDSISKLPVAQNRF